jgi:hypothetical protein
MSTYDDASLVLVPSGYKNGVVFSQKPMDANGQLTFTRASNATRVQSDGLIEKVRTNVALQSQTFGDATWVKVSTTITDNNQTAPDGTLTADTMTIVDSNSRITQSISLGAGTYTISCFIKTTSTTTAGNLRFAPVVDASNLNSFFTATSDWQRYSFTFTAATSVTSIAIRGASAGFVGTIAIWGFQAEVSDFGATDYIPTIATAVSVGPVSNLPRLNYPINADGSVGCPSLLLEPQRTNDVFNNTALNNYTATRATWGVNVAISPTGDQDAEKLIEDTTASNSHFFVIGGNYVSGTAYTWSIYVKADGRDEVLIQAGNQATFPLNCLFNLSTQTVSNSGSGTGAIINAGNGWYRLVVRNVTALATGGTNYILFLRNGGTVNYTGDGTSGVLVWGAQRETAAYETSLIPTLSTSVTRVADAAFKSSISSLIGQTAGTIYAEFTTSGSITPVRNVINLNNGGSVDFIAGFYLNNLFYARIRANSGSLIDVTKSGLAEGTHKVAIAYAANDLTMYIDGVLVGQNTGASVSFASPLGEVAIGESTTGLDQLGGTVSQALLFKTRLTNQQLQELTSL